MLNAKTWTSCSRRSTRSSPRRTSSSRCPTRRRRAAAAQAHDRRAARAAARAERGAAGRARRASPSTASSSGRARSARRSLDAAGRAHDRLGDRRGAGVRVDSRGRRPHPPDRRGRRARHVQPSPRGAARRRRPARIHVPLQALPQARASFEIHNSPLTENAAVGFEYGYNVQAPARLVIWEAQYGDFINGAQVMIDEFVVSARAKWGQAAVARAAAAARARRPGARSRERAARALPAAGRRHQHARSPTARPPRSTSTCCAARRRCSLTDPLPLDRADAEEPAAASARRVDAARAGRRAVRSR